MTLPQPVAIAYHRIHPQTRPGYILLKVANLDQQIDFYQKTLRLHLNWREGPNAGLGVKSQDLVRMTELPNETVEKHNSVFAAGLDPSLCINHLQLC